MASRGMSSFDGVEDGGYMWDSDSGQGKGGARRTSFDRPLLDDARYATDKATDQAHDVGFDNQADLPPYRSVIFVTISIFMGYACLNALQHKIKVIYGINDSTDPRSLEFSYAVSCLYLGNLVFRLMHNIVFAWLIPRHRVYMSFILMACSMSMLGVLVFLLEIKHMGIIFAAYAMGGVSIGTFESNLLSSVAPLGHATKTWAVIGIPVGYNIVNIGSFVAFAIDPDSRYVQFAVYASVFLAVTIAAFVFFTFIPRKDVEQNDAFVANLKEFRLWLPKIKWNALALNIDMFCVTMFGSIMMYIWDHSEVPLFGADSTVILSHNAFIALCNVLIFCGDATSRKVAYKYRPRNPLVFLALSAAGAAMCLSKVAVLAWPGIFLIYWANGSIYATTTRHVDDKVMKGHNLVALSTWLFFGDCGSVVGSLLLIHVKVWVGPVTCWHCSPAYS